MAEHASNSGLVQLSDGFYNVVRILVEKILPGLSIAYYGIAHVWDLPHADEVAATFAIICTFLGIVLTLARKGYSPDPEVPSGGYDGAVVEGITEDGKPTLRLQLDSSAAEDILNKKLLVFKGYDPSA